MASDNDQHELVLGNKQLLSIFFIVVVLLGVSFTIGYMIGKNTTASAASNGDASHGSVAPAPRSASVDAPSSTDGGSTDAPPPNPAPATPAPAPAPARAAETPASEKNPAPTDAGSYLQVAALKHDDANHIVHILKERGFPALIGESPKPGLYRVLVGPYKTNTDLYDSKQKLRAAGFETIVAR